MCPVSDASSPDPVGMRPVAPLPDSDDGVDVTLVRWVLSLSPQERLGLLQANADALVRLRDEVASKR